MSKVELRVCCFEQVDALFISPYQGLSDMSALCIASLASEPQEYMARYKARKAAQNLLPSAGTQSVFSYDGM